MEKIIIAALTGTTLMTLFSHIVSELANRQFLEPVLLHEVLDGLAVAASKRTKFILGWLIHYAIGLLFALCYDALWGYCVVAFTFLAAVSLGALNGIIGIIGWHFLFRILPYAPHSDSYYRGYYMQLIVAHVVFAVSVYLVYYIG